MLTSDDLYKGGVVHCTKLIYVSCYAYFDLLLSGLWLIPTYPALNKTL